MIRGDYAQAADMCASAGQKFNAGTSLQRIKDFKGAIAMYESHLETNPGDSKVLTSIGTAYAESGDEERGLQYMLQADAVVTTPRASRYSGRSTSGRADLTQRPQP